jgi:hypothetical protein
MSSLRRRRFLVAAGLTAVAGCTGIGDDGSGTTTTPTTSDQTASGTEATTPPADVEIPSAENRLPTPMAAGDLEEEAMSGGPPKDGIPSVDEPQFIEAGAADFLQPGDPVFGVARDGAVKAYPQKILVLHEIVNDELAGMPVSVTYCPLTGTVQGFHRGNTTFGVSGRLINNNLVMYDRASEAWWPQILATAIPGPWNETPAVRSLREFRLVWTTWDRWQTQHPETSVLSTDTGYAKNYNRDPYGRYNPRGGYYETANTLFPTLNQDERYEPKRVFMGARTAQGAAAFLKDAVRENGVMTGEIGDTPVLAVHDTRYDSAFVYRNPDETTFEPDGDTVVGPDGTGHDPDALPLSRIHTFDAMWFAWAGYYPETNVYD